jgi:hypothetical protein
MKIDRVNSLIISELFLLGKFKWSKMEGTQSMISDVSESEFFQRQIIDIPVSLTTDRRMLCE